MPSAEGLKVWGSKWAITAVPRHWQKEWKLDQAGAIGFYMGRSRIAPHVSRFFLPHVKGGIFVETVHVRAIDELWQPRPTTPPDLSQWQGHRHPKDHVPDTNFATLVSAIDNTGFFEDETIDMSKGDDAPHEPAHVGPPAPGAAAFYTGMPFARQFPGHGDTWFLGKLVTYNKKNGGCWLILYDDGDNEELTISQLRRFMNVWRAARRKGNGPKLPAPTPRHINTLYGAAGTPKMHRFDYGAYSDAPIHGVTQHAAYNLMATDMADIDDLTGGPRPEHYELQAATGKDGDAATDIPYIWANADGPCHKNDDTGARHYA
jgi:hypothetical protein